MSEVCNCGAYSHNECCCGNFRDSRDDDIDRLTDELAEAHKYRTELSTELAAYMVACENIKEELSTERMSNHKTYEHNNRLINQVDRYREALERIVATKYVSTPIVDSYWECVVIAREALQEDGGE